MTLDEQLRRRIELSRQDRPSESWRACLKLMEEIGELAEATLIDYGSLQYKKKDSDTLGEIADILNAIAAFLSRHYPDKSVDEIMDMVEAAGERKLDKYINVVRDKSRT